MKYAYIAAGLLIAGIGYSETAHWGYEGGIAPEHWAALSSEFSACAGKIVVDGIECALKQFHFHSPSENRIDGRSYPMESHLVHADAEGNLAVVAVLFEEGAENDFLTRIWAHMPQDVDGKVTSATDDVDADDLLPSSRDYYVTVHGVSGMRRPVSGVSRGLWEQGGGLLATEGSVDGVAEERGMRSAVEGGRCSGPSRCVRTSAGRCDPRVPWVTLRSMTM